MNPQFYCQAEEGAEITCNMTEQELIESQLPMTITSCPSFQHQSEGISGFPSQTGSLAEGHDDRQLEMVSLSCPIGLQRI